MYSLLISDWADLAVSDPCDGAATAAAGSATDTVTLSEMFAILSLTVISSALPELVVFTPVRRTSSNPGTMISSVYVPGATAKLKCPLASVIVDCASPDCSLRDMATARTTAFASGSCTTPAIVALRSGDCARTDIAVRRRMSASALTNGTARKRLETDRSIDNPHSCTSDPLTRAEIGATGG